MRHVIAIDQGTTGSTVLVLDEQLAVRGRGYKEFRQIYPKPSWVEHDPDELWRSQREVMREALKIADLKAEQLVACGITNQRETTIVWDRQTGRPIHRAIVWQDRRTAARCVELKEVGAESLVQERTGLVLDPYFSGTKLAWILDNVPGARRRARSASTGIEVPGAPHPRPAASGRVECGGTHTPGGAPRSRRACMRCR